MRRLFPIEVVGYFRYVKVGVKILSNHIYYGFSTLKRIPSFVSTTLSLIRPSILYFLRRLAGMVIRPFFLTVSSIGKASNRYCAIFAISLFKVNFRNKLSSHLVLPFFWAGVSRRNLTLNLIAERRF